MFFIQPAYRKWAKANNFTSMLPKDVEARKEAREAASVQSSLDPHLKEKAKVERVIPYSDSLFCTAAIEWLISTDQVSNPFDSTQTVLIVCRQ